MASRKEYEMLFALNARMNSGFSSAFSRAQAEFSRLGKEIQDLQKVQSNVSAYQKQQAVEATRSKLENLTKQQALLRTEIEEARNAGQSTAALEREEAKLEQRIANTNNALERQQQRLNQTGEALRSAGVSTDNLERESRELTRQLETLRARQEDAANGARTFGEQAAEAFEAVGQAVAAVGLTATLNEIRQAFEEALSVAADFASAVSNVEALSGASAQEIAALTDQAKLLGATTQFTAKQAADAMGYMAMAGWDAEEMLSGMDGVLSAAAASGEDLALVSDIITDSMSAFQLTAADTAHFADVLAAAATGSNTSISIMGETFKNSASVAGALGYSIEDVAVAVGLMANSGVKGSIAGTALKNTFNGLLEGVTLTSAAFGEYEYSAVRADGSMKEFGDTVNELRGYFEQMTEAERIMNAREIAGDRGYNGLIAILTAAEDSYASLTEEIYHCEGAAARMAAIKLDNLNGDIALAESAWEGFQIAVGEKATPAMRLFYQAQADVLSGMGEFVDENPALVQGIMATVGVLGVTTTAVTGLSAAVKVFKALDMASLFMGPAGLALKLGAGLAVAVGGVVALTSAYNEQIPPVRELTEAARGMQEAIEAGAAAYEDTLAETLAAANAADLYIGKLEALGDAERLSASQKQEYHNILALLTETIPELADSIDLENDTIAGGTAALRANTAAWQENAKAKAYQDYYTELYQQEADLTLEIEKNRIGLTKATLAQEAAEKKRADTLRQMEEANARGIETGDYSKYRELEASLDAINGEIVLAERSAANYTQAIAEGEAALADYQSEAELTRQAIESLTSATDSGTAASEEAAEQARGFQSVMEGVTEQAMALAAAYEETYGAALESMQGQYALWDEAEEVIATSADSVNHALESQADYWRSYNENLQLLMDHTGDIAGLGEMLASLDAGDAGTVNFVAGLADAAKNDKQALADLVANWQAAKKAQEDAADSFADYVNDFTVQMDGLQEELAADIEAMDMSAEARRSAEATIDAFVAGASGKIGTVRNAYAEIAAAARDGLGLAAVPGNGYVSTAAIRGYASGTENAPPGWAWVGEEGPELMKLRGGETILPATVSAKLAEIPWYASGALDAEPGLAMVGENGPELMRPDRGGAMQSAVMPAPSVSALYALDNGNSNNVTLQVSFSPTYEISGLSDRDRLETSLKKLTIEQREELIELILDTIADHERTKALGAYR